MGKTWPLIPLDPRSPSRRPRRVGMDQFFESRFYSKSTFLVKYESTLIEFYVLNELKKKLLNILTLTVKIKTSGLAAFSVNFHSLLTEVWSMVNSQIPPSTDQPGVDNALFFKNSTSTLGWPVRSGI